jgi:LCP family protein required for cell wall assembly
VNQVAYAQAVGQPQVQASPDVIPPVTPKKRWGLRIFITALVLLAVLALWPIGLMIWASGQINHVDALSGAAATPGRTFLLAGSDERGTGGIDDGVTGSRTDTIMILHQPASGPTALISIPRDTLAQIPGRSPNRINAAHAFGGPALLVATVEQMTGLTIDHYVEIGFGGIGGLVDALGGVRLCWDYDVDDVMSGMFWMPGCHDVGGTQAIAFSRMRYSDPRGDIGRAERQRQLISALASEIASPATLINPARQVRTISAGLDTLLVSEGTGLTDIGRMALAFRAATGEGGVTGTPPIATIDHRVQGVGSTVLLDPNTVDRFWRDLRDGNLEPGVVGGLGW